MLEFIATHNCLVIDNCSPLLHDILWHPSGNTSRSFGSYSHIARERVVQKHSVCFLPELDLHSITSANFIKDVGEVVYHLVHHFFCCNSDSTRVYWFRK